MPKKYTKYYRRECTLSLKKTEELLKNVVINNLDLTKKRSSKLNFDGSIIEIQDKKVYVFSDRYKTFFTKGYKCAKCGLTGKFFALEQDIKNNPNKNNTYHLNLYSINDNGDEVLMTKDHIIPKSKGGKNHISNYQTMCCKCNVEKADNMTGG